MGNDMCKRPTSENSGGNSKLKPEIVSEQDEIQYLLKNFRDANEHEKNGEEKLKAEILEKIQIQIKSNCQKFKFFEEFMKVAQKAV